MPVRFLFKNISSILISLILATLVWIVAVREQNPPREADYGQSIPIQVTPPADQFVTTSPLPDAVRLRLLAPESSWNNLSPSKFKASINLQPLASGLNDVPVKVEVSDPQIRIVELSPGIVTVNLEQVHVITLPLQITVLDSPPLGYISRPPSAEPAEVLVMGAASLIAQVDKAVSEIFIRNSKETIQSTRDVIIRNKDDQPLKGLTVQPAQVAVTLPIEQRFGYKDVSVRVRVQGQVAAGYRVSNISVDPPTLTVVGSPKGLSEITGLVETAPINLDNATENIVRTVSLNLPNGVTMVVSEEAQNGPGGVQVTVEITPIEDGITLERPITQQGIDGEFWWRASPNRADVFLSGPLTQLQMLRASDVELIVNLFGLAPGVHNLPPTVFKPEGLRVDAILPSTIEITIGRTINRPVTLQNLTADYTAAADPENVNLLLQGSGAKLLSMEPDDITVSIDLANLTPGFHKLKPTVALSDGLKVDSILPNTVNVIIDSQLEPATTVLSATVAPTETVSITATRRVNITATPQP